MLGRRSPVVRCNAKVLLKQGFEPEGSMGSSIGHADSIKTTHRKEAPRIRLHHGEAVWVMAHLGFQGAVSDSTFYEYIKSLRKLGIPFGKIGFERRGLANYSYCHLMELALVLTTRVYYFVPDAVLGEIIKYRRLLNRHYRQAYADRDSGIGAQVTFSAPHGPPIAAKGAFLDLQIDFSGGVLTRFGPPILLSPYQAMAGFAGQENIATRALLPINLSRLAERVVSTAMRAPTIRKGPKPANKEHQSGSRSRMAPVT
jgi:hypothetical protein